jgi:hypothetical protein
VNSVRVKSSTDAYLLRDFSITEEIVMKTLNYNQLEPNQQEQVKLLIAGMAGQKENIDPFVRFIALDVQVGEFR